jgi:hypothetical protein
LVQSNNMINHVLWSPGVPCVGLIGNAAVRRRHDAAAGHVVRVDPVRLVQVVGRVERGHESLSLLFSRDRIHAWKQYILLSEAQPLNALINPPPPPKSRKI